MFQLSDKISLMRPELRDSMFFLAQCFYDGLCAEPNSKGFITQSDHIQVLENCNEIVAKILRKTSQKPELIFITSNVL